MDNISGPDQKPKVLLEPFPPVSIFLCPCRVGPDILEKLERRTIISGGKVGPEDLRELVLEPTSDGCLGMQISIRPRIFFFPRLNWAVVALICELTPDDTAPHLSFEKLLAFNSNFRFFRGEPERQDTPVVAHAPLVFRLSNERYPEQIYEQVALRELGEYDPPDELKKAVTLSLAQFERELTDQEFYLFGTIAHHDEPVEPSWAAKLVQRQAYNRWRCLGRRFLVHSYSLVYACIRHNTSEDESLPEIRQRFLDGYLKMGVRVTLERALVLDLGTRLKEVSTMAELGRLRKTWVSFRRILGARWIAEGTQRFQIEKLWRDISELDDRAEEIDRRLEQVVDFFEAEATSRLNRGLAWFQCIFVAFAAATITAGILQGFKWQVALHWSLGVGFLFGIVCWLLTCLWGILPFPLRKSVSKRRPQ